jgi:hypothetical protein
MEAALPSETLVSYPNTTWCHKPRSRLESHSHVTHWSHAGSLGLTCNDVKHIFTHMRNSGREMISNASFKKRTISWDSLLMARHERRGCVQGNKLLFCSLCYLTILCQVVMLWKRLKSNYDDGHLDRMWQVIVVLCFKVQSWNYPGATEEINKERYCIQPPADIRNDGSARSERKMHR